MSSPWLVPTSGSIERDEIERAYGALLAGDAAASGLERVRPVVRESWTRSVDRRVHAEGLPELELSGDALEAYRAGHPLSATLSLIRTLLLPGASDDAGVVVAVGDAAGRLLWIEGDRMLRSRAGDMGFVEGANWSEERVGTAAPGTALALGRSVQVRGAEHFNRFVQPWSCTAAPVRDPETGTLLGVIDVTGGNEAASAPAQMLVDATARAVEGELLVARLREGSSGKRTGQRASSTPCATLSVLGRDRAVLTVPSGDAEHSVELGLRHAEIVLMLATHRQGLTAERLAELVYGDPSAVATLRPEMVRLRRLLAASAPDLVPESRPYRISAVETDAQQILALLDRGAHRVALAAFRGDALPDSVAPGVEELRERVRTSLRETLLGEAGVDVLLSYLDTDVGADDADAMRQVLRMLPPRSPRRAGLVARLESFDRHV
ncbi:GAF domain-containing protein [Microbacterium sp. JB110]|uniref:GAF domain-containing protein n=1 Tax=Microbacterium sp. JB110 TaxID=2024477 RepID=UPI00097F2450|nr:GAF domain-containing protein [Microbacterium sp. JB110]RCS60721.1 GAF domain-containing protein [Microbacterium sp. JB110]SJM44735.1 GAF domain-containing protein / Signal transduction response regulator [Frigoribacterium sp. JB110]